MSDSCNFGIFENIAMPTFQWHKSYNVLNFNHETTVFGIRAAGVISLLAICFSSKDSGQLGDALDKPR
jgi:hypothetical protein